jgi:hypothetical protein
MLWCKKCGTGSGGRRVDHTHTYACYLHGLHTGSLDDGEGISNDYYRERRQRAGRHEADNIPQTALTSHEAELSFTELTLRIR